MKKTYDVTGMSCSACSAAIERSVRKLDGLEQCDVNLLANKMTVSFDENQLSSETIMQTVEQAGYHAEEHGAPTAPVKAAAAENPMEKQMKTMKNHLIISVVFMLPLFYLSMGHMMGWPLPSFFLGHANTMNFALTQFLLCLPIVIVNGHYFTHGFKNLWRRSPNMDSLIAIGSAAAIIYGIIALYEIGMGLGTMDMTKVHSWAMDMYFETSAMILTLITLGKYLETRSKGKTSEAIAKLIDLAPKTAWVRRGEDFKEIPVEEVRPGDHIRVKPGQSVPVDGVIVQGSAAFDESAITGESIPVERTIGEKIIGATVNKSGVVEMEATLVGEDTTLSQIIRLVEEASSSKAPIAKLADKVSGVFVPVVITIAIAAAVIWLVLGESISFAVSIGIAVLVISCPCALGLATPTAIMVGTGKGAENGILIKSGEALETAHSLQTVILDKTGTVTTGKPEVVEVVAFGENESVLLNTALSLEIVSEHPLAEAIVRYAKQQNASAKPIEQFENIAGQGVSATIDNQPAAAGNLKMMQAMGLADAQIEELHHQAASQGRTPLFIVQNGAILGMIAVADTIKPTSRAAVAELKRMGIDVVLLTGDNPQVAQAIAQQAGIDKVIAEVLPSDKQQVVSQVQAEGRKVAMIGDGINDAPALAQADVGIAIGAGTDVAIESADIVLMKSDLWDAVTAIKLSKAVLRNIKQNLFWALIYNSIGIPLAAGVFIPMLGWKLNPMFGAAAMSLSSVSVVSNALRLKLFSSPRPTEQDATTPAPVKQAAVKKIETITKGEKNMTKTMIINGMACAHCKARVEAALKAVAGVENAEVTLEEKKAVVSCSQPVEDSTLIQAVTDAGYEVVSVA